MSDILLIDDMLHVRRALAKVLGRAGHSVTEAGDGEEGLRALQSRRFDLVITDILMPKKDGTEVLVEIRRSHTGTKVLAISGGGAHVSADHALKVAASVADAILIKPFENEELIAAIDGLLAAKPTVKAAG